MGKPGPISTLICLAAAGLTVLVSLICLPAAELLPAQVEPGKRDSGESLVRSLPGAHEAMKFYGNIGLQLMHALPQPQAQPNKGDAADAGDSPDVMTTWSKQLVAVNGEVYGQDLKTKIADNLGGQDQVKSVLELLKVDKNFIYNSYALFLAIALFAGAVAIQAMGRWGAEEKTILPAKK